MPRVPSDPAQVIVNHASFRVQLGAASGRALGLDDTARIPAVPSSDAGGEAAERRKLAPVVWSGRSQPGDLLAGELLRAVREAGGAGAATTVLPRVEKTAVRPTVVGQRSSGEQPRLLSGVRPARGAYDPGDEDEPRVGYVGGGGGEQGEAGTRPRGRHEEPVRHAWYPGRRMNLGIVLLPLRIFLGFVCIYAGVGKLCDRVYFDGGSRGSMVTWLSSLHPWALAEPLRDAALNHPVGAGLSIAFLQVAVGVLTVFGLWQRVAAVVGAALSIALLVTVSWRTVPVYDAPDFIYLAAWSPLIIAGAPVYSIDGHLAGDAWRRLGPRVALWDLRRRVLRRGAVMATVVIGLTMLVGSVLGAAVRATTEPDDQPGPAVVPTNNLPGSPLPEVSGTGAPGGGSGTASPTPSSTSANAGTKAHKKAATPTPTTAPGHTYATNGTSTGGGKSAATGAPGRGAGAGSGAASGSGSGSGAGSGSSSGGTSQAPQSPAAPPAEAPPAPQPSSRPSQGTIGGLLGSRSPRGLLLGMSPEGRSGGRPGGA